MTLLVGSVVVLLILFVAVWRMMTEVPNVYIPPPLTSDETREVLLRLTHREMRIELGREPTPREIWDRMYPGDDV